MGSLLASVHPGTLQALAFPFLVAFGFASILAWVQDFMCAVRGAGPPRAASATVSQASADFSVTKAPLLWYAG